MANCYKLHYINKIMFFFSFQKGGIGPLNPPPPPSAPLNRAIHKHMRACFAADSNGAVHFLHIVALSFLLDLMCLVTWCILCIKTYSQLGQKKKHLSKTLQLLQTLKPKILGQSFDRSTLASTNI